MAGVAPTLPMIAEQRRALLEHIELSLALHGEHKASRMMRKFGIKFSAHHPNGDEVKREFIAARTTVEWMRVIDRWYPVSEAAVVMADCD